MMNIFWKNKLHAWCNVTYLPNRSLIYELPPIMVDIISQIYIGKINPSEKLWVQNV